MHHHILEGHLGVAGAAMFVDLDVADLNGAIAAIEHLRWRDQPLLQRCRGGDDLEGRSRLVEVLDVAVLPGGGTEVAEAIRIERGNGCHRQHGSVGGIHDHDRPACGVVSSHCFPQRALGDELNHRVDGQHNGVAVDWTVGTFAADQIGPVVCVAQQGHSSGAAPNPCVEGVFDSRQPFTVGARGNKKQ